MNPISFFGNIGTGLTNKISIASKPFNFCVMKVNASMESQALSINELKDTFLLFFWYCQSFNITKEATAVWYDW